MTSNLRYRFKCQLVKPNGKPIRITGIRWTEFCKENIRGCKLLHFIQQGDDTFYVTCYDEFGYEAGGYPGARKRPQRLVTRVWPYHDYYQVDYVTIKLYNLIQIYIFKIYSCLNLYCVMKEFPPEFLQGLIRDGRVRINANVVVSFNVSVEYVETENGSGKYKYRVGEEDWNAMAGHLGLESGMVVVFTRVQNNPLYLMAFNPDGTQVTIPDFQGLTSLKKVQRPLYHFEKGKIL